METTFTQDVILLSPFILVSCGAFLLILLDSLVKGPWSRSLVAACVLAGALVMDAVVAASPATANGSVQVARTAFFDTVYTDPFACFFNFIILAGSVLVIMLGRDKLEKEGVHAPGDFYALMLMSTAGAMLFVSAAELITLFLGLEIMSMALYALCGAALGRQRSPEAALKYFLLGSFSSAFMLYGIALLYGLTGSTVIADLGGAVGSADRTVLFFAMGLIFVGFVFKIGLVPFHFWAPDVYQGAPTPVTAFMACVIKASAVGAALRVFWVVFADFIPVWSKVVWLLAVLTMAVGNLVALHQRSVKRMLAYSSIAHAGYLMMGFLTPGLSGGGGGAILYYLVVYTVMTLGAFGVVMAVTSANSEQDDADDITRFNGFGHTHPVLGALMAIFLLSLAGIPPGFGGLLGKFYIFNAAIKGGNIGLAIIGVLCAAVGVYYYLRVIVAMYFIEPEEGEVLPVAGLSLSSALGVCVLGVILLGLFPSLIYNGAQGVFLGF